MPTYHCTSPAGLLDASKKSAIADLSGLPKRSVWVYVSEIPARQMAEYGHILPEPGGEQAWLDRLPAEDRAYMQSVGK